MKKLLLTVATFSALSAGAQTIYSEDFTDYATWTPQQAWSGLDADGDGHQWGIYDYTDATEPNLAAQGIVAGSQSWDAADGPLTPNNFFISPAIDLSDITGDVTLTFKSAGVDPDFQEEHYAVYIVSDMATFNPLTATADFEETIATGGEFITHNVDMSDAAGSDSVYVVFRHYNVTDMFILAIDDVMVSEGAAPAGVNENVINASVYPNPANDILNVTASEDVANVTIVTMDGKVVASADASSVNVTELNAGMYIYTVTTVSGKTANGTFAKK